MNLLVFKRRDKRSWARIAWEFFFPKGGWHRAVYYLKFRLKRLPGTPERIARGLAAGVFAAFTPFYGIHFIVAAIMAYLVRGNILAGILGTLFGNPLTYVPIGVISMKTGYFLLGIEPLDGLEKRSLGGKFIDASSDLWQNFLAIFTNRTADWDNLIRFWHEVFFPYLIGGIIPGAIVATICYFIALPAIRAYQNRRKGRLRAKIAGLNNKKSKTPPQNGIQSGD